MSIRCPLSLPEFYRSGGGWSVSPPVSPSLAVRAVLIVVFKPCNATHKACSWWLTSNLPAADTTVIAGSLPAM
jgi:hypothetical protein